jgi:hypothetical protein
MLRAGICDLRTCDLEMGCPAGPPARHPGRGAARPGPPACGRVRPETRGNPDTLPLARRLACAQRPVWPATGAFHLEGPDLRRYRLMDDDLPHSRPAMRRVSRRDAAHLRPGMPRVSVSGGPDVSTRQVTRVSPGGPRCFRRDSPAFTPDGGRGRPCVPGTAVPAGPVPEPAAGLIPGA